MLNEPQGDTKLLEMMISKYLEYVIHSDILETIENILKYKDNYNEKINALLENEDEEDRKDVIGNIVSENRLLKNSYLFGIRPT